MWIGHPKSGLKCTYDASVIQNFFIQLHVCYLTHNKNIKSMCGHRFYLYVDSIIRLYVRYSVYYVYVILRASWFLPSPYLYVYVKT